MRMGKRTVKAISFKLPAHDHHNGPVCEQMALHLADSDVIAEMAADPMNDYAGFVPELPEHEHDECKHYSCQVMIYEDCIACEIEAQIYENDQTHFIS